MNDRWQRRSRQWTRMGAVAFALALGTGAAPAVAAEEVAPPPAPAPAAEPPRSVTKKWEHKPATPSADMCLDVGGKGGSLAITCGAGKSVTILDLADGKEKWTVVAHDTDVVGAALSTDGELVVTGSRDGKAKVWRVKDSAPVSWIEKKDAWFYSVDVTPDGTRAAAADFTGVLRTFPTKPGAAGPPLRNHNEAPVRDLAIAPGGKLMAATDDTAVSIHPVPKGAKVATLDSPGGSVLSVAWSDDGRRLAVGTDTGMVRIYDALAKYKELGTFDTGGDPVQSLAFSPKGMKYGEAGAQLVTGHANGRVAFWDSKSFAKLGWFQAHTGAVGRVRVAAGGALLVTVGDEGVVSAWEKPFPALDAVTAE